MPARVLALVAAVLLVAGALVVRSRMDQHKQDLAHPVRLVCIEELAEFCRMLPDASVTVEPAGVTADRLANAADPAVDGWLTLSPWPDMVDELRAANGLPKLFTGATRLARTELTAAIAADRYAALQSVCPNRAPNWKCIGQVAAKQTWSRVGGSAKPEWGPVKVSIADPATTAVGLAIAAAATVDYFGKNDLSSADLDDAAYQDWLHGLAQADTARFNDFASALVQMPASADVYASTEADIMPTLVKVPAGRRPVDASLTPTISADVVMAPVSGSAGARLKDAVQGSKDKLADWGWRVEGRSTPGLTSLRLPPTDGLPDAGLMIALRNAWKAAA